MNPKAEIFFDAITGLREDLVEDAQDYRFRRRSGAWKKFGSLAACLALIASLSLLSLPRGCGGASPDNGASPPTAADSCAPGEGAVLGGALQEPEAPAQSPEGSYGEAESWQLDVQVVELREGALLAETKDGPLLVVTEGLALPELRPGDRVRLTVSGHAGITSDDPPVLPDVTAIEKLEE